MPKTFRLMLKALLECLHLLWAPGGATDIDSAPSPDFEGGLEGSEMRLTLDPCFPLGQNQ